MKRAMKFIWMMLFAIPMITITSCSKEDDNEPDSKAEITIGKVTYTIDSSRNRVDFEVPITSKHIKGDLRVTYTIDEETIRIYPSDDDPDLYLFTIRDLIRGESYRVTIKATYGDVSDTKVVKFTMSDSQTSQSLFKDYSVLIGKTRQGVVNYMGTAPFEQDEYSQFFIIEDFETTNVVGVEAWYVDIEDNILDKVSNVFSLLNPELKNTDILNYLKNNYEYLDYDEDGYYYKKDNLQIIYFPNIDDTFPMVLYVDMQTYFPVSRAGEKDLAKIKEIVKAHKHISF